MPHFDVDFASPTGTALRPMDFVRLLRSHVSWWAVPAVVCALVAGAYSLVTPHEWKATQALIIRPEVASVSEERLGKFTDLSEMKTSQETVLELAKSQTVVAAALKEVGPPSGYSRPAEWPTALDIEDFREDIDMRPPGGAEFGKTEVFYLSASATNRGRASALVVALCNQLERRMQELRDQSAKGMIAELERTVAMANSDLSSETLKLSSFEASIGADLSELRSLNAEAGSQSEVSQELQGIEAERRANEAAQNENERLLKLLVAAKDDPQQLLATPNSLLVSQPSISQLKNALVTAQLRTAELLGTRSESHPFVVAARENEQLIRKQLHTEVEVAIRGLQVEVDLCADREKSLATKKADARERISRLAESRAEYTNLVSAVQNHTRLVEAARKNLADARARQAGAHSASVISRIDGVDAGVRPIGPGRKTVAAAGGLGGLLVGFGFVFLFAAPTVAVSNELPKSALAASVASNVPVSANPPVNRVASVEPIGATLNADVLSSARRPVKPGEAFGMFRGMSLKDAVKAVQQRC